MNWFKTKYNTFFLGFLLSVIIVFFYVRPLRSPWHPFIAGDGLGYYAYLPAKYIHNDPQYDFKWFNKVYNANYVYDTFDVPDKNILVDYADKKINKYYQGLSYIWLPFFVMAHIWAKVFHYSPDGFSAPYQLFMGLASLFYLFLGLFFLRKLLFRLFQNQWVAAVVPVFVFYGTHLFSYAISANTLSHAYSFTFIVLFLYFLVRFFQHRENRLRPFLWCLVFLIISACIRPLNVLIILVIPAFLPKNFFKEGIDFGKFKCVDAIIILIGLGAIYHQLSINYIQTNSLIAYTYTDEKFDFENSQFIESLFSYHLGLFVYVPLIFVSLFGIPFVLKRKRFLLPGFFFFILFLYSSWWYWPIVKRAMVDFYVFPAIFLAGLLNASQSRSLKALWLSLFMLCTGYYQFKNFQLSRGILDEFSTYKEVFWQNFFRTEKANIYLIPPKTIKKEMVLVENFESGAHSGNLSKAKKSEGNYSLLLDSAHYLAPVREVGYPDIFKEDGCKKIRFSFDAYFEAGVSALHAFIQFFDANKKLIEEVPFYINSDYIVPGKWDRREFGYEIVDHQKLNNETVKQVVVSVWNVEGKKKVYVDAVKVEFILTDRSFETVK